MGVNLMACTKQIGHSCEQILDECRFHSLSDLFRSFFVMIIFVMEDDENISFLRLIIVEIPRTFQLHGKIICENKF